MKYRAVLLDLDDTFYPYAPCHAAGLLAAGSLFAAQGGGLDAAAFEAAYARHRAGVQARLKATASAHNRLLYFQNLVEASVPGLQAGLALDLEASYWAAYFARMESTLDRGAASLLASLRAAGSALALVTDLTAAVQLQKLRVLRLDRAFDRVVTSEEAGGDKPYPASVRLALEKLGISPAQAVLIGDSAERDGGAAAAAGVKYIHHQAGAGGMDDLLPLLLEKA